MLRGIIEHMKDRLCPRQKRKSWALNQLDVKLEPYLRRRNGYFIEAGANNGIRQSNTLYFEKYLGWRGLLIEAVPALAEKCRQNRPQCLVENCALVSQIYRGSTIDIHYRDLMSVIKDSIANPEEEARHLTLGESSMKPGETPQLLSVPAKTLSRTLDEHHISHVDLLSLDVEGYEAEVLKGLDFNRHRPAHMLIEVRDVLDVEKIVSPWYRQVGILNSNPAYADILYARKN